MANNSKQILDTVHDVEASNALMEMYDVFPVRLRLARCNKWLTQNELAAETGIKPSSISQYESGKNIPDIARFVLLAHTLGVSLDWLCGLKKERGIHD